MDTNNPPKKPNNNKPSHLPTLITVFMGLVLVALATCQADPMAYQILLYVWEFWRATSRF